MSDTVPFIYLAKGHVPNVSFLTRAKSRALERASLFYCTRHGQRRVLRTEVVSRTFLSSFFLCALPSNISTVRVPVDSGLTKGVRWVGRLALCHGGERLREDASGCARNRYSRRRTWIRESGARGSLAGRDRLCPQPPTGLFRTGRTYISV